MRCAKARSLPRSAKQRHFSNLFAKLRLFAASRTNFISSTCLCQRATLKSGQKPARLLGARTASAMQEASTRKIYDIHSMFYDATFGRLVKRRIERAIDHMNIQPDDRILDLGIGTGVSLN